ncbi:uncharacterized protein LOC131672064 [Phymastichus coffea]|uniref:uncharacterized protein LOC131672064 n=1 Tax=Phymastichus coffea TaxID=108790 RepID=UPI00273CC8FB|nr:uncharacterized protein LOC131672064 [Phymastichus coffea]
MPTCKYFLEGCCIRDRCPYLHVKVSSKSPICVEFLRGYCLQGHNCQKRHIYTCPEFEKSRKCSKIEFCPYPHKRSTVKTELSKNHVNSNTSNKIECLNEMRGKENPIVEYKKRYYENLRENLNEKNGDLLKLLNVKTTINAEQIIQSKGRKNNSNEFIDINKSIETSSQCSINTENFHNRTEWTLIGPLPSYIPIDK